MFALRGEGHSERGAAGFRSTLRLGLLTVLTLEHMLHTDWVRGALVGPAEALKLTACFL